MDQIVKRPNPVEPASIEAELGLQPGKARQPRRRRWPWAVALLAVAGIGAYYYWGTASEAPVSYIARPIAHGKLVVEVAATGTLQPLTQVDVSSELSGVIRSVNAVENQQVARGDVLAQLDTVRISAQIERAEANVTVAEARVTDARVTLAETEQTLARSTQLAGRGMVAEQGLETARAARDRAGSAVESADAQLAVARADLKLAQADFAKSTIYAPINGIVLTRSVNPGQTVASSMSAPILFVIAEDLTTMELRAAIDEADIGQVAKGQPARFTVDAFPSRRFDAQISDISYASVTTEGVVTYEARLAVTNPELLLRPGMTATVNIVTRESDNALLVPSAALRFTPPTPSTGRSFSLGDLFNPGRGRMRGFGQRGGQAGQAGRAVYVLENGEPVRRQVEVGATSGDMTEIVSGLNEGDRVITGIGQMRGERAGPTRSSPSSRPPSGPPPHP